MEALLLDLYDTIMWTDWPVVAGRLTRRLGVSGEALMRAYELTRPDRGRGRFGSVEGDLGAVIAACGLPAPRADELAAELVELMKTAVRLYDDVLPVVRRLRSSGVRVAVVSNCDHVTRPVVDHLGLDRELDAVVLSCEVGSVKPEPAIFHETLRRLGVAAPASVFVDDQARYLDGAASLGMRTFRMVRDPAFEAPSEDASHPKVASLAELP